MRDKTIAEIEQELKKLWHTFMNGGRYKEWWIILLLVIGVVWLIPVVVNVGLLVVGCFIISRFFKKG